MLSAAEVRAYSSVELSLCSAREGSAPMRLKDAELTVFKKCFFD